MSPLSFHRLTGVFSAEWKASGGERQSCERRRTRYETPRRQRGARSVRTSDGGLGKALHSRAAGGR